MTPNITLYHCWTARSFRALWALEELGLKYTLETLPFPPRALKPEFLEINPLGTVPFFVDRETCMTESAAITEYLAARYGASTLGVAPHEPDYGAYLNFLHHGEATLTFPQTIVLRYNRFEAKDKQMPQVADDYARWFLARLKAVDRVLQSADYLAAGRFTAADISVGYAIALTKFSGLTHYLPPAVAGYGQRLQQRPAYRRALEIEDAAAAAAGLVNMTPAEPFLLSQRAPK